MNDDIQNDTEESFAELFEKSYQGGKTQEVRIGDKIRGNIISITRESVFMDTGTKIDGVVDRAELMDKDGNLPFQVGDLLELYVTSVSENEIVLSKALSGAGGLDQLREAQSLEVPVEGKVSATCKGGFNVDILGHRAFCPVSQIDLAYVDSPGEHVGRTYSFLITRIEEGGRNIVVSRKELLKQAQNAEKEKIFESLTLDSEWEGTVVRLMPFGAFVDIGSGVEGMVHISELAWSRVETPEDLVKVGDRIRVKVIGIKPGEGKEKMKLSLSAKQVQGDPWEQLAGRFAVGDILDGKVMRCAKFGAFVEIAPGIEGLVHISEMSFIKRVVNTEDVVNPGDLVSVFIKELDIPKRRISLSIRETQGDPWVAFTTAHTAGQIVSGILEKKDKVGYFINLAPGVTGLLPQSKINQSAAKADFDKLKAGETLPVLIDEIRSSERKISLAPEDTVTDKDWKQHAQPEVTFFGSLGEKLQQALAAKEKK